MKIENPLLQIEFPPELVMMLEQGQISRAVIVTGGDEVHGSRHESEQGNEEKQFSLGVRGLMRNFEPGLAGLRRAIAGS